jgi:hypothetical protein
MKKKTAAIIFLGVIVFSIVLWKTNLISFRKPCLPEEGCVAAVKNDNIIKSKLSEELELTKKLYEEKNQDLEKYPSLEKTVLEELINKSIVTQYAEKNNMSVTEEELNNRYKYLVSKWAIKTGLRNKDHDLSPDKLEAAFLSYIRGELSINKKEYLGRLRFDLLQVKVAESVDKPLSLWLSEEKKKGIDRKI